MFGGSGGNGCVRPVSASREKEAVGLAPVRLSPDTGFPSGRMSWQRGTACTARHRDPPPEGPAVWLPWGTSGQRLRSWNSSLPQGAAALIAAAPKRRSTALRLRTVTRGSTSGSGRGRSVGASSGASLMAGHVRPRRCAAPRRPAAAATRSRCPPVPGPATERPLFPIPERLANVQPVEPIWSADEGCLWNEFVARGFSTLPGVHYFVRVAGGEPLAVLGFGAAA